MSLMSSLCFVAKLVSVHYFIWEWLQTSLTRLSYRELPVILTVENSHETQIKGHHVYKDIWLPELGEHLEVQCEPENVVDKYTVCLKTSNRKIIGHLKKEKSGRFAKAIFYYLRSHPQANCAAKVTGKKILPWWWRRFTSPLYFPDYWRKEVYISVEKTI